MNIHTWAVKHSVGMAAIEDLFRMYGMADLTPLIEPDTSEAAISVMVRLEASRKGLRLWRNNVGAMYDENGNFVRFGLANDSAAMNKTIKSADLIGIRPIRITAGMTGSLLGQFVSREVKRADWTYAATEREVAQLRWIELITSLGGDAQFAAREGTL